uniref:Lipocalin n=1 Tax=Ixodes ricinus TaxID=34613 RepID=B7ZDH3_IXORI|nr:lipocalin [Ixodes ricinus]
MLALKHLVFCVSVFAVYADVVFDNWKKPPDNNPDLNRKDLGAMQDAWKTIKCMANQSFYLIYSSGRGTREHYPHMSCLQVQTSDLNNTLKSAKYTSKWYDTESKTMQSSTQYVQAAKQKDYSIENIMHLACEFWLREDWLKNITIPQVVTKRGSEECAENEKDSGSPSKTTYSYDSLFKELPSSCRYAFLLNCGYPTHRIYDEEDCKKICKRENAASGDAHESK